MVPRRNDHSLFGRYDPRGTVVDVSLAANVGIDSRVDIIGARQAAHPAVNLGRHAAVVGAHGAEPRATGNIDVARRAIVHVPDAELATVLLSTGHAQVGLSSAGRSTRLRLD